MPATVFLHPRSVPLMRTDPDILSVFDGIRVSLEDTCERLDKVLGKHREDLDPEVADRVQVLIHDLRRNLDGLTCDDGCGRIIAVGKGLDGVTCQPCADRWTACARCGHDVRVDRCLYDRDDRPVHPDCFGSDFMAVA